MQVCLACNAQKCQGKSEIHAWETVYQKKNCSSERREDTEGWFTLRFSFN